MIAFEYAAALQVPSGLAGCAQSNAKALTCMAAAISAISRVMLDDILNLPSKSRTLVDLGLQAVARKRCERASGHNANPSNPLSGALSLHRASPWAHFPAVAGQWASRPLTRGDNADWKDLVQRIKNRCVSQSFADNLAVFVFLCSARNSTLKTDSRTFRWLAC